MTDELPEIHDTSRLDRYMAARRRAALLNASWRPMLAGAVGAALVIGAVWVTLPKISYREIEVPRVTMRDVEVPAIVTKDGEVPRIIQRDVTVDHIIPRDVEIAAPPREVSKAAPVTPRERTFTEFGGLAGLVVRGRIIRPDGNGFVLATPQAGEQKFYPGQIGLGGKVEPNPAVKDVVDPCIGSSPAMNCAAA